MADGAVLTIRMFGGFTMSFGDVSVGDHGGHPSKIWNLLAYLIVYKHRDVSQAELIERLWPDGEDVGNPVGALKTLMHRTRAVIDELGLDGKALILSRRGTYRWNREAVRLDVDTDSFEQLCQLAEKAQYEKSALPDIMRATELYHGDFLKSLSSEAWVIPLAVYYNSKYISMVYAGLELLLGMERYEDVVALCRRAIAIAPYDEPLNAQLIEALVKLGRYQLAMNHYRQVTELLYQEFAITPSEEFHDLYREIIKQTSLEETCLADVNERIRGCVPERGAYFCEPAIFEEICRYDARTKMRSGGAAFLGLLTLRASGGGALEPEALSAAARALSATIRDSLRSGDCFSHISASQFAVLLQNTTYEKGTLVLMRVIRTFRHQHPDCAVSVTYNFEQIDPMKLFSGRDMTQQS